MKNKLNNFLHRKNIIKPINPNRLDNWVDKCDYIIDNFKKYECIYLIFEMGSTMFFCNYYLLDRFNDLGFNNIKIHPLTKGKSLSYVIGKTMFWAQATSSKLKEDLGNNILPLHFTVFDFSPELIIKLNHDIELKNQGKKNQGIKKIYKDLKGLIESGRGNRKDIDILT